MTTDNERDPMTHEIVRNVKTLAARLARHAEGTAAAKAERQQLEVKLLDEVLAAIPPDVFDALSTDRLTIVKHEDEDGFELYLLRIDDGIAWGMNHSALAPSATTWKNEGDTWTNSPNVIACFALAEVIGGVVNALAKRIDGKHEGGRKLTRVNRRLRGILSILDNS